MQMCTEKHPRSQPIRGRTRLINEVYLRISFRVGLNIFQTAIFHKNSHIEVIKRLSHRFDSLGNREERVGQQSAANERHGFKVTGREPAERDAARGHAADTSSYLAARMATKLNSTKLLPGVMRR
ncbi:unnamed protein product [Colias eurytheme]|nr:unnamed protein product [Colias eurytheme]